MSFLELKSQNYSKYQKDESHYLTTQPDKDEKVGLAEVMSVNMDEVIFDLEHKDADYLPEGVNEKEYF